jgi:hypothetical protein
MHEMNIKEIQTKNDDVVYQEITVALSSKQEEINTQSVV